MTRTGERREDARATSSTMKGETGDDFKRFGGDKFGGDKFGGGFRRDRDDENWGEERRREGYFQHDERRDPRKNLDDRRQKRRNEPEWMNETIAQNDFSFELRGFEDPKPAKKKEPAAPPAKLTDSGPRSQPRKKSDGEEQKSKTVPAGPHNIDILSDLGIGSKTNDEFNFDAMMELM